MPSCVVNRCRNCSEKHKKGGPVSFHRFPTDPILRQKWTLAVRKSRQDEFWKPSKYSIICSSHFKDNDLYLTKCGLRRVSRTAVPIKNLNFSEVAALNSGSHDASIVPTTGTTMTDPSSSSGLRSKLEVDNLCDESPCSSSKCVPIQEDVKDSDIDSVFDTPRRSSLKKQLRRHQILRISTKRKLRTLQQKLRRYKKRNSSLKGILQELHIKNLINADAYNVLKHNIVSTELFHNLYQRTAGKKKLKFSPAMKKFCLTLNFYSPKAYDYVRKSFNSCLPHPKTLAKWYAHLNGDPGFTEESFVALKQKAENSEHQPICALMFDEMAIRQQKIWNGKKYIGVLDMGEEITNSSVMATQALVFMLVGINKRFKIPLGYFLTNNLNGEQKANLIKICLMKCHEAGVKVVSLTFDAHSTNMTAAELLGCNFSNVKELKTTFKHPVDDREIVCFIDPSHVIKLLRNHLEVKQVLIDSEGNKIKWNFLLQLNKLQEDEGLHLANKLSRRHILYKNQIMKVKLATQILSRSVGKALELCRDLKIEEFKDSKPTQNFVEMMNDTFDIFNTRAMVHHGFKKPIYRGNKNEIFTFLDTVKSYVENLDIKTFTKRQVTQDGKKIYVITPLYKKAVQARCKRGFIGTIINIESLKCLYDLLVEQDKCLAFLPTYKFSQDHLEIFFSSIRMHGGHNDNPNVKQFKGIYRKLLTHLELKTLDTGNCVPLESIPILTCQSSTQVINSTSPNFRYDEIGEDDTVAPDALKFLKDIQNDVGSLACHLDIPDFNDLRRVIVGYIAGSVVHYLCKIIKCEYCLNRLASMERYDFHKLINLRNKGALCYPSLDTYEICCTSETVIRKIIKENVIIVAENQYKYITLQIFKRFCNKKIFINIENEHESYGIDHKLNLIKCIIEKYMSIRLHYLAKREVTMKNADSKRQYFNKLTQNKGY